MGVLVMNRVWAVLAVLALLGVMVAAPASAAAKPISGRLDIDFVGPPASGCTLGGGMRTWVGTVDIGGQTYGWADFSTGLTVEGKFISFTEYWTIFDIQTTPVDDSCDESLILLDGTNDGWGSPGGTAKAEGTVLTGLGSFDDVELGSRMFWRGRVTAMTEDGMATDFVGTLHILPPR
jgi:hypothetical protein